MKKRLLILALGACLLSAPLKAREKGSASWKEVANKDGGFVVLMPGTAVSQTESLRTPSGPIDLVMYIVERKKEETVYIAMFCEMPENVFKMGTDEQRLDYARKRAVASTKGKLVSEKKIKLGTYPGRELVFELENKGQVRQRVYAVKDKLYQLLVSGPREQTTSKDADRFLDSFKLK
jgi:hypothetical protein